MTAATLHLDLVECQARTRRTMTASIVLHALLFLWIATIKSLPTVETPPITEILMLSPGELTAAAAGPSEPAPRTAPRPGLAPRKVEVDQRFVRNPDRADITLDPQSQTSIADQMMARLSHMT
ncbi:MAG: hypothetical protein ACM3PF_08795, partial [Bacteroidota bacterium]